MGVENLNLEQNKAIPFDFCRVEKTHKDHYHELNPVKKGKMLRVSGLPVHAYWQLMLIAAGEMPYISLQRKTALP